MAELLDDGDAGRRRRKRIALVLLALLIVLLIVTIAWWRSLPNEGEPVIAEEAIVAPVTLDAADLFAAYENDPTLSQFEGSELIVTGTLTTIPETGRAVLLRTPDPLLDIAAELAPADATLLASAEPGAEVTLRCEGVAVGLRAPALESCIVATAR